MRELLQPVGLGGVRPPGNVGLRRCFRQRFCAARDATGAEISQLSGRGGGLELVWLGNPEIAADLARKMVVD